MVSRRVLWIVLTVIMAVCLDLIIARFLMGVAPLLAMIVIVLGSFAFLALAPSPNTKRAYKIMFLAGLVVSAALAIGFYTPVFESMTLLDDSLIDISHSAALFHLQNNGLPDWTISEVRIGNVTFTLQYPHSSLEENLQLGDTAYLVIHYAENVFQLIPSAHAAFLDWTPANGFIARAMEWPCLPDEEVSPSTFQNGSAYQVVFNTDSFLKRSYSFNVEAELTQDEELNVTVTTWPFKEPIEIHENRVDIWFIFNNTGNYYAYIYSIQIANVTFYFDPLIRIHPFSWARNPLGGSYSMLINLNEDGLYGWAGYDGDISSNATLTSSMLQTGMTYNIIVETMANNLYVVSLTI